MSEGENHHLDWHLSTPEASPTKEAKPKENKWDRWKRPEVVVAIAALLVSIVFGLLQLRGDNPVDPSPANGPEDTLLAQPNLPKPPTGNISIADSIRNMEPDSLFFGEAGDNDYKILVLGFVPYKSDKSIVESSLINKIRTLENKGPDWSIAVQELPQVHKEDDPIQAPVAKILGEKLGADMVVWGGYGFSPDAPSEVEIKIEQEVPLSRFEEFLFRELQGNPQFKTLPYPQYEDSDTVFQSVNQLLYFARGTEHQWEKEYAKALSTWEQIKGEDFYPLKIRKINGYLNLKQYSRALNAFQALFETATDKTQRPEYWWLRGRFLHEYGRGVFGGSKRVRYDSARVAYGRALSLDENLADIYFHRGRLLEEEGDYMAAYSDYSKAIALRHMYMEAYYRRARLYQNNALVSVPDRFRKAAADYSRVIELHPEFGYAYHERGRLYHQRLYDDKEIPDAYERAMADYNRAEELLPSFAYLYQDRGKLYQDLGKITQARSDYDKATQLEPKLYYAYRENGRLATNQGQFGEALSNYSEAFKAQPTLALRDPQFTQEVFRDEVVRADVVAQESTSPGETSPTGSIYQKLAETTVKQSQKKELLFQSVEALQKRGEALPKAVEDSLKKMIERDPRLRSRLRIEGK